MKVTAQEEYGLRCILRLARKTAPAETLASDGVADLPANEASAEETANEKAWAGTSLTVGEIAEREGLSAQYAGKLIRMLGKAALVESVRGCKGGYRLARPSDQISVAEALAALGSKFYEPEVCERFRGDRTFCVHTTDCSVRSLWSGLQLMIDHVLARTTLRDLVGSERTMTQWMAANAYLLNDVAEGPPRSVAPPVFTTPVSLNKET
jgi:Rrf2 family iron-sulfur cluster assembly transcriptional regulator